MAKSSPPLLLDVATLRARLWAFVAKGAFVAMIAFVLKLFTKLLAANAELLQRVAQHRRARPHSETTHRLQLELAFVASTPTPPKDKPRRTPNKRGPKQARTHGRGKLPDHLPREEKAYRVAPEARVCPDCAVPMGSVGFKTRERLELVPAHFVVVRERFEVCSCPLCRRRLVKAEGPDEVCPRGKLGATLLVESCVDHFGDAVPWERLARKARDQGVPLAANVLAASVGRMIDLFDPIVAHVHRQTFTAKYLTFDPTSLPVLDPDAPLGIRSGALWGFVGDHRWVTFLYAPTGHHDPIEARLRGYTLHTATCDGSSTNNFIEELGAVRGGCWSHARRPFVELVRAGLLDAMRPLALITEFFVVEAQSQAAGESHDARLARRQRDTQPFVTRLREWVDEHAAKTPPRSTLGQAIGYLRRQWSRLTLFLRDGQVELTNNEPERELRTPVLNRKSWFFVGHDTNAHRAANIASLLATCRRFGLDARRYLRDTLQRILDGEKDLTRLLPENFVPLARDTS